MHLHTTSSFLCHFEVEYTPYNGKTALLPLVACLMQSVSIGVNTNLTHASPYDDCSWPRIRACLPRQMASRDFNGLRQRLALYLRHYGLWDPSVV